MSLRVWLPLTKDLRNQGLDDVTVTNNGATFNSSGKLGGCYSFSGSSQKIVNTLPSTITSSVGSLSCWIKMNSLPGSSSFYSLLQLGNLGGYATCRLGLYMEYTNKINISIDGSSTGANVYTHSLVANQWYHICATYDGTIVKLYIDGNEVLSKTASKGSYTTAASYLYVGGTSSYYLNGYMNDARYYDHALSQMEVKELSKGLVLHYPLNRGGWGQENLASQYIMPGGNKPGTTATNGRTNYYGDYGISIPATENADTYFSIWYSEPLESGATYTLSAEVSGLLSGSYYSFHLFAQDNTSMGIIKFNHNGLNTLTFTMNYTGTIATTTYNGKTYYRMFMDDVGRVIASGQGTITIKNIKLEKGSIATPWCPNSSDVLATTMSLNGTTEYDTSGYGNNGTRTGTPIYTSDTPKYAVSTQFTGTQYILSESPTTNGATLAAWVKTTSTSNQALVIDYKSGLGIGFWSSYIVPSCNSAIKTTYPNSAYHVNEWNHIVIVKNSSSSILCYVNGELQNAGSAQDYWSTGVIDGFSIAARPNGASPSTCQISDVRIYATALSADDVKSLYQNSAYIDSSGNVYGTIHES